MQTLFIDRKNSEISIDGGRLSVSLDDRRPKASFPTSHIDMLVVSTGVNFSSTLLTRLTQEGITAVFLNPFRMESSTITCSLMHNDANRRLLQYRAISDPTRKLAYSQQIVTAKLRGQQTMLRRALKCRPDQRHSLTQAIERISALQQKIAEVGSADSLRGVEGAAAAAYFQGYQSIFAPSLNFTGRNRRPPKDPVNAVLSLTYTLLHAEAVRTLFATGFDPHLGIYHDPTFGRESLACDMVELFRPFAERWVWRLFADEQLRADHFSIDKQNNSGELPCLLGKRGREIFYPLYARKTHSWRRLMRRTARNWLKLLQESAE